MSKIYEQKLYRILDEMDIVYEKYEHPAFPTVEASGDFYKRNNMGVDCKNIFMRNRRGKKHYIVVVQSYKNIDIPNLAEFLGENRKMGFASEERLLKYLGLKPGSVTPFGIIYKNATNIPVVVDKSIFDYKYTHFHPFRNTASVKIKTRDFKKFLDKYACLALFYDC